MARPTTYRREIADRIVEAVANGGSIKKLCKAEGVLIGTLYSWADHNPDFAQRLEQARLRRYDLWEEELFEHAQAELGSESMAAVQARRTLIDTMKWIMARRLPTKWSEAVTHQHLHNLSGQAEVRLYLPVKGAPGSGPLLDGQILDGQAVELLADRAES